MSELKRNAGMTREAGTGEDIENLKHLAIDKLTAAHIAVGTLNRYEAASVEELEKEEKTIELMEDATYYFRKYLRAKLDRYEKLLRGDNNTMNEKIKHAFDEGNKIIGEADFTREV